MNSLGRSENIIYHQANAYGVTIDQVIEAHNTVNILKLSCLEIFHKKNLPIDAQDLKNCLAKNYAAIEIFTGYINKLK